MTEEQIRRVERINYLLQTSGNWQIGLPEATFQSLTYERDSILSQDKGRD